MTLNEHRAKVKKALPRRGAPRKGAAPLDEQGQIVGQTDIFDFEEATTECPHCGRSLVEGACSWCDRPQTPTKHLHRAKGPDTSKDAAGSINATDLESLVYWAIEGKGRHGATADELRDLFPDLSYSSITARPAALKRKGLIFDSGNKRAGKSGRAQAVLVASKFRTSESNDPVSSSPVPVPPSAPYPPDAAVICRVCGGLSGSHRALCPKGES